MKRILTLAAICLFVFQLNAQTLPQGIAYQAVAAKEGPYSLAGQNAPSIYWSNKDIQVRFTILDKYPSGTSQYSEVHATTTDGFGVFNLIIGQGDVLSGDFTKIPWELGTAHLQVEIDFDNDGSFKLTSLEKFWSVPYAFITRKSSSTSTDSSLNALNNKFNYLRNRDKDTVIGNEGGVSYASLDSLNQVLLAKLDSLNALDKDTVIGNELQNLSLKGDSLFISEGNVVKINHPVNLDNDSTNELQSITLADDTITLSKGGGQISLSDIKSYIIKSTGGSSDGHIDSIITATGSFVFDQNKQITAEITIQGSYGGNGGIYTWTTGSSYTGIGGEGGSPFLIRMLINMSFGDTISFILGQNGKVGQNISATCCPQRGPLKAGDGTDGEITNILLNGSSILKIKGGKAGDGGFYASGSPYARKGSNGVNGALDILGDFQKSGLIIIQESIGDKNSSSFVRIRF
jgi:hypothetical protein